MYGLTRKGMHQYASYDEVPPLRLFLRIAWADEANLAEMPREAAKHATIQPRP